MAQHPASPPPYIANLLGPAPIEESARRQWNAACAVIEAYRRRWGVDHPISALGAAPRGLAQVADRDATVAALRGYQHALLAYHRRQVLDQETRQTRTTDTRLPLEPLLRALGLHTEESSGAGDPGPYPLAAQVLGVNRRTVYRYRDKGLNPWTADRLAIAAGLHPRSVWGEAWDRAADAMDRARRAAPARDVADGRHL